MTTLKTRVTAAENETIRLIIFLINGKILLLLFIFYNITVKLYQINAAFEYGTTKHF